MGKRVEMEEGHPVEVDQSTEEYGDWICEKCSDIVDGNTALCFKHGEERAREHRADHAKRDAEVEQLRAALAERDAEIARLKDPHSYDQLVDEAMQDPVVAESAIVNDLKRDNTTLRARVEELETKLDVAIDGARASLAFAIKLCPVSTGAEYHEIEHFTRWRREWDKQREELAERDTEIKRRV